MTPSLHVFTPDSSVNALIKQRLSSSSPTSLTDSPTTEPSFTISSPSECSAHACNPQLEHILPSSSSSSFSLVPERKCISGHEGPRWRGKKKRDPSFEKPPIHNANLDLPNEDICKQPAQRGRSAAFKKRKRACHDNSCCKCLAGFTVDCAAVCCCPLALLNLAALAFIRLPTSVAWKMLVNLKDKLCSRGRRHLARDVEDESPRPRCNNPWPYGSSPEGNFDLGSCRENFDRQNLWQHFEAERLYFGGLSMRKDHGDVPSTNS